jgi:hypothetical protein
VNLLERNGAYGNGLFGIITFGLEGGGTPLPPNAFVRNDACGNNQDANPVGADHRETADAQAMKELNSFCTSTTHP